MYSAYIEKKGEGKDIVFLHGWGANRFVWADLTDDLTDKYCCHLVDLPGFGNARTDKMPDFDELVEELAERLPEHAVFCGWSLGGLIAMAIAIKYPKKVKKLITISSSPCFVEKKNWPGIAPDLLRVFRKGIDKNTALTLKRFIALQSLNSCSAKSDRQLLRKVLDSASFPQIEALKQGLVWLAEQDLRHNIEKITQPWHAFFSQNDAIVPLQTLQMLTSLHSDIKTEILFDIGYFPIFTYREKILSVINNTLI